VGRERAAAIVLAAGSGSRLGWGAGPKALLDVAGEPMVTVAVRAAASVVDLVVVAAPPGGEEPVREALAGLDARVVAGGSTRQASVLAALGAVPADHDVVIVHDAARPFATPGLFSTVVEAVRAGAEGAVPVVPIHDTVKRVRDDVIVATEDRSELMAAQSPQAFRAAVLRDSHELAHSTGIEATDDATLVERAGYRVVVVPGEPENFKITTMADLERAGGRG
jgi:2-C-methyl-D-erythritol 4-phosphate cytidylyltransferase